MNRPARLPTPGKALYWSKQRELTTSLLGHLACLPKNEAHKLFTTSNPVELVDQMFVGVDTDVDRKRIGLSIGRRLAALYSEYTGDIFSLIRQNQENQDDQISTFLGKREYWLDLHELLRDHPKTPNLNAPNAAQPAGQAPGPVAPLAAPPQPGHQQALAGPVPPHLRNLQNDPAQNGAYGEAGVVAGAPGNGRGVIVLELDEDDNEDAMQGVEFQPLAPLSAAFPPQPQIQIDIDPPPPQFPPLDPAPPPPPPVFHGEFASPPRRNGHCLLCEQPVSPRSLSAHEATCYASATPECVVCGLVYDENLSERDKEAHLQRCCEGGSSGPGGQAGRRDEFFTFKITLESMPRTTECGICFEDYEVSQSVTRLACACVFHESCISDWWEKQGATVCTVEH